MVARKAPTGRLRSLKVTSAFRTFVLDQLGELDDVVPKAMFGGVGLYSRGVFFGIIARDVLYLKVDERNRPDFERAGMAPFKPYADRSGTMKYYAVPLDVLESARDLVQWAGKAVAAAESGSTAARRRGVSTSRRTRGSRARGR